MNVLRLMAEAGFPFLDDAGRWRPSLKLEDEIR